MKLEWEEVSIELNGPDDCNGIQTCRAKVAGGYIYRTVAWLANDSVSVSTTFVEATA